MREDNEPIFLFEKVLQRVGKFFISARTLTDIDYGFLVGGIYYKPMSLEFSELLKKYDAELLKIDDELFVIKKL